VRRVLAWVAVLVAALVVVHGAEHSGASLGRFLRDPTASPGRSPYHGVVSNLGLLVWAAAATACLLAAALRTPRARFLGWTGAGLAVLAVDDAAQLHEAAWVDLTGLGDEPVLAAYALAGCAFATRFRAELAASDRVRLVVAAALLAASMAADAIPAVQRVLHEEATKYVGLAALAAWAVGEAARDLRAGPSRSPDPAPTVAHPLNR
jgi:hypothetical protein